MQDEDSRNLAEELGPLATVSQSVSGEVVVLALPLACWIVRNGVCGLSPLLLSEPVVAT